MRYLRKEYRELCAMYREYANSTENSRHKQRKRTFNIQRKNHGKENLQETSDAGGGFYC